MKDLEFGMPIHLVPKTFQHAAIITARLGYRYLWIDSLCIVQDCESDWIAESSIMGEIYRGSICTIAALEAKDSYGGCFQTRNPLMFTSCRINNKMEIGLRRASQSFPLTGELLERGWVVQERVLAPRTLFYGSFGISWECNEVQMTEEGVTDFGDTPKADFHRLSIPLNSEYDIRYPSEALVAFHKTWAKLLESYTSTKLTRRTDKLVAIHGIILKIAKTQQLTSMAGLWLEILPVELLWCTEKPCDRQTELYIAPSWSWASVDAPVTNRWTELTYFKQPNRSTYLWEKSTNKLTYY
jgi:hypothetical protein